MNNLFLFIFFFSLNSFSFDKKKIIDDHKNRVHKEFKNIKFFKDDIRFWFDIYTKYSSEQVVIYDKRNPDLVYKVLDFKDIISSKLNKYAKEHARNHFKKSHKKKILKSLKRLHLAKKLLTKDDLSVLNILSKIYKKIPKKRAAKKSYFKKIAKRLRIQTGQKDFIEKGMGIYKKYETFLNAQIKNFSVPKDVIALGFLESSFNDKAVSKANAAGIWQFIPLIGSTMMPTRTKYYDLRVNPFISTIAAFHLLKENKQMLGNWNMAIIAYNSGIKHLRAAQKKYGKKVTIEKIFQTNNKNIGYASKSYLAEFYALTRVFAYKEDIFKDIENPKNKFKNVNIYISRCSVNKSKFTKKITEQNSQFRRKKKVFKRGTLISFTGKLSKRYVKLSNKEIRSRRPKKWKHYIRKKKCNR